MTILTNVEALPSDRPVFIYGTGVFGRCIARLVEARRPDAVAGFIDSALSGTVEGKPCWALADYLARRGADDVIVICSQAHIDIRKGLEREGIDTAYNAWPMLQIFQYRPDVEVRRFAERTLAPGDVVLDVGANIGVFSAFFAGRARRVYAFEPNPRIHGVWRDNLKNYGNVELLPRAVSDRTGTATFYLDDRNPEGSSSSLQSFEDYEGEPVEVACTSIDAFCREHGIVPDFIKLDVEGHEPTAVDGAWDTIRSARPKLVFEFPTTWWHGGYREMCLKLNEYYHLVRLESGIGGTWRRNPIDLSIFQADPFQPQLQDTDLDAMEFFSKAFADVPFGRVVNAEGITNIGCIPRR